MNDIPMGLGMALAQNPDAMQYFSSLADEEQKKIVDLTHSIHSKQQMQQYVQSFTNHHSYSN